MPEPRAADPEAISEAARLLQAGELVAFPTETVYGLGADARSDEAVAAIFAAKNRPSFNPLIAHFAEVAQARQEVLFDERAEKLAEAFWPGPLTLVLPRREGCRVSLLCSAGLDSQAVRLPSHPVARALLSECGIPLAAPSANLFGRISPTLAEHVAEGMGGRVAMILDGGACQVGVESTVVELLEEEARLLRPGAVTLADLERVIGPVKARLSGPITAPGMLESHYAPSAAVRLEAERVGPEEALLAFGPKPLQGAAVTENLSPSGDLLEAAANLFAALHRLDATGAPAIAVMPIPHEGLGLAINDRLERAAAPRPVAAFAETN
jgi:L-threonylcarbamoyladenylate synthase